MDEADIAGRYRERVEAHAGLRLFEADDSVAADGSWEYSEVFLDRAVTKVLGSESEARAMAASAPGCGR